MDIALTEMETELVEAAKAFGAAQVAPEAARWEAERRFPADALRAAAEAGITGLFVPRDLGGSGISLTAAARITEELAAHCAAFTFSLLVHNNLAGNIARNGTKQQIDRFLPAMLRAERFGAFCLTEPGAGSDATAITTRAERDGGDWLLTGEKAWITNGAVADVYSIYAQTDPEKGWRGIACFLAEATTPGLDRTEPYALMGAHAMATSGLKLDGCRLGADGHFIPPGDGFKAAMQGINLARALVGALCCGIVRASLDAALAYAGKRTVFGRPVAAFQGIQWQLADVATDLEAARLLTYNATRVLDQGGEAVVEAAHAKKFATRIALTATSACMQVLGAEGYKAQHPFARHMACAKMAQYIDGTTEIQNVVVARELLKAHGIRLR